MKHLPLLFKFTTLFALLLLTGCIPFLHALYTPETTVFREELVGVWKEKPDADESWNFTKGDEKAYLVTIQEKDAPSKMHGKLVKLGEYLFLDLFPADDTFDKVPFGDYTKASLVPAHILFQVKIGKTLELRSIETDALKELLAANPKLLPYVLPEKNRPVVTATTEEMQKFFTKHAATPNLWSEPEVLQKVIL